MAILSKGLFLPRLHGSSSCPKVNIRSWGISPQGVAARRTGRRWNWVRRSPEEDDLVQVRSATIYDGILEHRSSGISELGGKGVLCWSDHHEPGQSRLGEHGRAEQIRVAKDKVEEERHFGGLHPSSEVPLPSCMEQAGDCTRVSTPGLKQQHSVALSKAQSDDGVDAVLSLAGENGDGQDVVVETGRLMQNGVPAVRGNRQEMTWKKAWFPYLDEFKLNEEAPVLSSSMILEMLDPYLGEGRKQRIEKVVANRTFAVCPVVEGLFDLGNIAAVFRSADALGYQSVHVISNRDNKRYRKNKRVSVGAEKWLDVESWVSTASCVETLRARGYRIAATHIASDTIPIHEMDWTIPTAVIFGNEDQGISEEALSLSDVRCSIPMMGMVDSFNVSVAAGILLHFAAYDRISRMGVHGDLLPEERQILSAEFYMRVSHQVPGIIDRLLDTNDESRKGSLSGLLKGELETAIEEPDYLQVK